MAASYLNLVQYIKQKKWILCLAICLYSSSLVWGGFFLYQCIIIPRLSPSITLLFRQGLMSQRVWSHSCSMLNFRPSCYSTSWGVHQQTLVPHPRIEKPLSLKVCCSVSDMGRRFFFFTNERSLTLRQTHCQGCENRTLPCSKLTLQSGPARCSLSSVTTGEF